MSRVTEAAPAIIIYGGAFDPPHTSHVAALVQALARFPAARGLVLPAPEPAGAGGQHKTPAQPFADRLALTRLAFAALSPRVEVSSFEADLPGPHYTVQTLTALAARHPELKCGLLIGQDQLESFARWREPRRILELASLIVLPRPRPGDPAGADDQALRAATTALAKTLGLAVEWEQAAAQNSAWLPELTRSIHLLYRPVGDAASSVIREHLRRGEPLPDGWLPPPVERAIRAHHYYGT